MDDRMCAADRDADGGASRFVAVDEHGPRLDREFVNARIRHIVLAGLVTVVAADSPEARGLAVGRLIDRLIAHVDETVDAALAFAEQDETPY